MSRKITMNARKGRPFSEVYGEFITSQTAKGVSDVTIRNHHQVLHNISKFFDVEMPMERLSKSDLDEMVVEMRAAALAHNTITAIFKVCFHGVHSYRCCGACVGI